MKLKRVEVGIREIDVRSTLKLIVEADKYINRVNDATRLEVHETPVTPALEEFLKITSLEYLSFLEVDFLSLYEDTPYDVVRLCDIIYGVYLDISMDRESSEKKILDDFMEYLRELAEDLISGNDPVKIVYKDFDAVEF